MKYYVVRPSFDLKVIGHYPQVKDIKHNCHVWSEPRFVEHIHFQKSSVEPIVSNAILYNRSKATDLIDVVGMGFTKKLLVSEKLKSIILSAIGDGVQFFSSGVHHKNKVIQNYWIMNIFKINMDVLDFEKSVFVYRKRKPNGGSFLENVKIKSLDDFNRTLSKKKELNYINFFVDKIELNSKIKEDFITLLHVNGGVKYIVSESLKREIENSKCTGIEFMPVEMELPEWLQGGKRERVYGKL